MGEVKITQTRSVIGRPPDQRRTMRALGLRGIGRTVVQQDTDSLRGMLVKVEHLVSCEPVSDGGES